MFLLPFLYMRKSFSSWKGAFCNQNIQKNLRSTLPEAGLEYESARFYIRFTHPPLLAVQTKQQMGPRYFVFCRLYPYSPQPPRQYLGPTQIHRRQCTWIIDSDLIAAIYVSFAGRETTPHSPNSLTLYHLCGSPIHMIGEVL
jgi:hypothetical protein